MSFPGIYKLGQVSIMLQIWRLAHMHFFLPEKIGVVECLVLTSIWSMLGDCLYAQSCAVEHVFGGRHVAAALQFFHNGFVDWNNGRMVRLYEKKAVL